MDNEPTVEGVGKDASGACKPVWKAEAPRSPEDEHMYHRIVAELKKLAGESSPRILRQTGEALRSVEPGLRKTAD